MPARNAIKTYIENGYYHLYNRGVEKRNIFQDNQDFTVFRGYLSEYLSPKDEKNLWRQYSDPLIPASEKNKCKKSLLLNNYYSEICLLAYCLRPNHFHFFVKQRNAQSIDRFMHSLCTRYTAYFNRKYQRIGTLYQGVYKAVAITHEAQYLHITRYIHLQAIDSKGNEIFEQTSSYPEYTGSRTTAWVHPEEILTFFSPDDARFSYRQFVTEYRFPEDDKNPFDLT